MLYWNTVTTTLKAALHKLMQAEELIKFRLVGGTALSLHLGHRMSVDIDLFTDAIYGSIDFDGIEDYLKKDFPFVSGNFGGKSGMGKSYLIGNSPDDFIKLDIYYSMDPFFQEQIFKDGIRMATIEEIIAMKIDIVQRIARKKDFWDLHELLERYPIEQMIDLHRQRFEWTHDRAAIYLNMTEFSKTKDELDPICLRRKEWAFIEEDFTEAMQKLQK